MKKYMFLAVLMLGSMPVLFGQVDTIKSKTLEDVRYQNIAENGYQGNIVVDVVDENNMPITDYKSVLRSGEKIIFDVPQAGPRAVFFENSGGLTLEIEKKGYKTYVSKPITTDDKMEMACVIKIILIKE